MSLILFKTIYYRLCIQLKLCNFLFTRKTNKLSNIVQKWQCFLLKVKKLFLLLLLKLESQSTFTNIYSWPALRGWTMAANWDLTNDCSSWDQEDGIRSPEPDPDPDADPGAADLKQTLLKSVLGWPDRHLPRLQNRRL